jgi:hypothetical protein
MLNVARIHSGSVLAELMRTVATKQLGQAVGTCSDHA